MSYRLEEELPITSDTTTSQGWGPFRRKARVITAEYGDATVTVSAHGDRVTQVSRQFPGEPAQTAKVRGLVVSTSSDGKYLRVPRSAGR